MIFTIFKWTQVDFFFMAWRTSSSFEWIISCRFDLRPGVSLICMIMAK